MKKINKKINIAIALFFSQLLIFSEAYFEGRYFYINNKSDQKLLVQKKYVNPSIKQIFYEVKPEELLQIRPIFQMEIQGKNQGERIESQVDLINIYIIKNEGYIFGERQLSLKKIISVENNPDKAIEIYLDKSIQNKIFFAYHD